MLASALPEVAFNAVGEDDVNWRLKLKMPAEPAKDCVSTAILRKSPPILMVWLPTSFDIVALAAHEFQNRMFGSIWPNA
jgi:hypothetical protein